MPFPAMTKKEEFRRQLRARRRQFVSTLADEGRLQHALETLADRVIEHLGDARSIAAYWPSGAEVDTAPLLRTIHALGRATGPPLIGLPHIESPGGEMRFLRWCPGDPLEAGAHGLRQPRADADPIIPDLVLTPLVGFDRRLMRLGQGAGYYDRLFALHPSVRRIGLAWSVQEVEEAPADPWDIALHGLATEREWIESEKP